MRVPISWLYEFIDLSLSPEELAETLTLAAGLEVEHILRPAGEVTGVRLIKIESFAPVPGADTLSLVQANDGERIWEIVCGANNFAVGDIVPACLPGSKLPGGIEIATKKLMGVTSHGMLASPRELGLFDDPEGIWILPKDAPVGAELSEWLNLDEAVLDLDVLPDRGYAASLWGLARDLSALTGAELTLPEGTRNPGGDVPIKVTLNEDTGVRRWDGRSITQVSVRRSPVHAQVRLGLAGMRPINSVVDATNYAMLETGYPSHAYDTSWIKGGLTVRRAVKGEEITTLDGETHTLTDDDVVIADETGALGLAGVMGGAVSEISKETTSVYVEVAAWDPIEVLRSGRRHGIKSEARSRFERTVSPQWLPAGASRVNDLIIKWSGGEVVGGHDYRLVPDDRPTIPLDGARIRSLLGVEIPTEDQAVMLTKLGAVVEGDGDRRSVTPPPYRPDLTLPADLAEEIARMYGYDNIPMRVPSSGRAGRRGVDHDATLQIRHALAGAGWNEALCMPFIADDDLASLGWSDDDDRRDTIALVNPLSAEESVLRTTLLPGLCKTVRWNVNRKQQDLALFETGHVFIPPSEDTPAADGGPTGVQLPGEPDHLALIACGLFVPARHDHDGRDVDLADLLGAIEVIRSTVGAGQMTTERFTEAPFHPGRAATVFFDGVAVGVAGELHPRVCDAFEIPRRTVAAELNLSPIIEEGIVPATAAVPSPLPSLSFDIAAVFAEDVPQIDVAETIRAAAGERLTSLRLFDVYRGEQVGDGNRSLAYRLVFDNPEAPLTDADETAAIERIIEAVEGVGGEVRR